MRKIFFSVAVIIVVVGVVIFAFRTDRNLVEKKNEIINQAAGEEVNHLLVFKNSPKPSVENRYNFSPQSQYYSDEYAFDEVGRYSMGLYAFVNVEEEIWNHSTLLNEVMLKDEIAYHERIEMVSEEANLIHIMEQVMLYKDNINYLYSYNYSVPEAQKDDFNFIKFLEDNLIKLEDIC